MSLLAAAALGVMVAGFVAWQARTALDRSDGEPPQVIVATWLRDHDLGWLVARLEDAYYATIARPQVGGVPTLSADLAQGEEQAVVPSAQATAGEPVAAALASPDTRSPRAGRTPSTGPFRSSTGQTCSPMSMAAFASATPRADMPTTARSSDR